MRSGWPCAGGAASVSAQASRPNAIPTKASRPRIVAPCRTPHLSLASGEAACQPAGNAWLATARVDRVGLAPLSGGRSHLVPASQPLKEQLADAFKAVIANAKLFEMGDRLE